MKFGVDLGRCNPRVWFDVARHADALGYESLWLPEHLVFPATVAESPAPGRAHGRVGATTPPGGSRHRHRTDAEAGSRALQRAAVRKEDRRGPGTPIPGPLPFCCVPRLPS